MEFSTLAHVTVCEQRQLAINLKVQLRMLQDQHSDVSVSVLHGAVVNGESNTEYDWFWQ